METRGCLLSGRSLFLCGINIDILHENGKMQLTVSYNSFLSMLIQNQLPVLYLNISEQIVVQMGIMGNKINLQYREKNYGTK